MGAGRQRWWQAEPFAVAVREDDWNPTKNPTGYSRMVIGGVEIGSAVSDVVEEWMRAINAALPARIVRLEAELEMRRRRDVDRDMELEAGKTLGAVSDEALLDEFERRGAHLEVELYERRNERKGRGRTLDRWQQEFLGEWSYSPRGVPTQNPPRRCDLQPCPNYVPREARYCARHRELADLEGSVMHFEMLGLPGGTRNARELLDRTRQLMMEEEVRLQYPGEPYRRRR